MEGGYSASSEDSDTVLKDKIAKATKRRHKVSTTAEGRARSSSEESIHADAPLTATTIDVEVQDEPAVLDHPNFKQFQKNMTASDEDASHVFVSNHTFRLI